MKQNFDNLPPEIRNDSRFFPVNENKSPKINAWSDPQNQHSLGYWKNQDCLLGFDISSGNHPFVPDYLVLDFDHIFNDGKIKTNKAEDILKRALITGTFAEYSMSLQGAHFVFVPTENKFNNMNPARLYLDDRTDLPENQRAKLEIFYLSHHYFIFTGNKLEKSSDIVIYGKIADNLISDLLSDIYAQKDNKKPNNNVGTPEQQTNNVLSTIPLQDRVQAMLDYIDPSTLSYDDWIKVGMIIKTLKLPFEMWDSWSQRDPERYNEDAKQDCASKWPTFSEDGSLGIGTLYRLAEENGYSENTFRKQWYETHGNDKSDSTLVQLVNMQDYLNFQYSENLRVFRNVSKIKTGLKNLDDVTGGISPGLYVLGAIPSLGKTTFMHQISDNIAQAGQPVLFFSLEQTAMELASKSIARESYKLSPESALTAWGIQMQQLNDPARQQLFTQSLNQYKTAVNDNLIIVPGIYSISLDDIINIIEEFVDTTHSLPVVIIDYLQIISVGKDLSDKMRVDLISSSLKKLQSRLNLSLFIISSFNRSNYLQTVDYESFKESGNIEYSADAVWGLQLQILNTSSLTALDTGKDSVTKSAKRNLVEEAKKANPRKIELKALKHRNHPLYSLGFLYYPAHDYFMPDPDYNKPASTEESQIITVPEL